MTTRPTGYFAVCSFNHISTGGEGVFSTPNLFLPVTFLFLSQFPLKFGNFSQNLIQNEAKSKNFQNSKPGSRGITIFGEWF